ncbi:MAG: ParB/RepB/Spo0J family partition protein [Planctomycetota bacterium]|nr:MAG: ParB/RepB/Spo0J family partition protein [Planctomycetota bacterium]
MPVGRKLGKGLDSLLASRQSSDSGDGEGLRWVSITSLIPNREQPRKEFNVGLDTLIDSVRQHGIMQPIVVTPSGPGKFEILAGERRWRAAQAAGLDRVPVVMRDGSLEQVERLELALIENIQREDLNPIERAQGCQRLLSEYELTQSEVAKKLGYERSTVANLVRLLELPQQIQEAVSRGTLSAGHARTLLRLNGDPQQEDLFHRILQEGLSVRVAERLSAQAKSHGQAANPGLEGQSPGRKEKPAWVGEMEDRLTRALGGKVEISLNQGKGGRLSFRFNDLDQLDSLVQMLHLPSESEELLRG